MCVQAKNRQTAKAFRNKMDGMKAYAEMRVSSSAVDCAHIECTVFLFR